MAFLIFFISYKVLVESFRLSPCPHCCVNKLGVGRGQNLPPPPCSASRAPLTNYVDHIRNLFIFFNQNKNIAQNKTPFFYSKRNIYRLTTKHTQGNRANEHVHVQSFSPLQFIVRHRTADIWWEEFVTAMVIVIYQHLEMLAFQPYVNYNTY